MLRLFLQYKSIPQVAEICNNLNAQKQLLRKNNWEKIGNAVLPIVTKFDEILEYARASDNEALANSQYVFRQYYLLFFYLSDYFKLLVNKEYKTSWMKLQDCFDQLKTIGKFSSDIMDGAEIQNLLEGYEKLYPYEVFTSSEFVIKRSHCSICGKSMQQISCPHICGNLYWGDLAYEVIEEIETLQAISLVSHPEDKRMIIELSNDTRTEEEKFEKLVRFLELGLPPLQLFTTRLQIEKRKIQTPQGVGRNTLCPCGSGKKYKKCCGEKLYYDHQNYIIAPERTLELIDI